MPKNELVRTTNRWFLKIVGGVIGFVVVVFAIAFGILAYSAIGWFLTYNLWHPLGYVFVAVSVIGGIWLLVLCVIQADRWLSEQE